MNEAVDLTLQCSIVCFHNEICTVVYYASEHAQWYLVRLDKQKDAGQPHFNSFEVHDASLHPHTKLLNETTFTTTIFNFVKRKATESIANNRAAATFRITLDAIDVEN